MEDEDFDKLYEDILNNGLVNEDYKQKFTKIVEALKARISEFSEYSELDAWAKSGAAADDSSDIK